MKQCPKCQASISDTAKFCMECGCNIKKYEEEHAQPKARFCPECGTEIPGGSFCPECGYNINNELNGQSVPPATDAFGDDWLADLESSTSADVANMKAKQSKEQMEKALAAFEYEEHADGTYTITGLKDKHALNITVPNGVVAIGDSAFEGCDAISMTLPEGLLKIGNAAFKNAKDLSSINFPKSLFSIGDEAFAECEMLDIEIPSCVRKIGKDVSRNTLYNQKLLKEKEQQQAKRQMELMNWQIGNVQTFGSYYKDNSNEKQPIEWIVVDRDGDNTATLWSYYAIEYLPYDQKSAYWETCDLRKWLNETFVNIAFDPVEQDQIVTTKIYDSENKVCIPLLYNVNRASQVGVSTRCKATAYAKSKGAVQNSDGYCIWRTADHVIKELLPSGGISYDDFATACVDDNGVAHAKNIKCSVDIAAPIRVMITVRINI